MPASPKEGETYAEHDEHVGHVENPRPEISNPHIHEINHPPIDPKNAIEQIACAAAHKKHHPKRLLDARIREKNDVHKETQESNGDGYVKQPKSRGFRQRTP